MWSTSALEGLITWTSPLWRRQAALQAVLLSSMVSLAAVLVLRANSTLYHGFLLHKLEMARSKLHCTGSCCQIMGFGWL